MSAALLYRPSPKWQISVSLVWAALIHLAAVALAERQGGDLPSASTTPGDVEVVFTPETPESDPIEPGEQALTPPLPTDDSFITDENPTPPPRRVDRSTKPLVRRGTPGALPTRDLGNPKVLAIAAPRPEYPYEARRARLTGFGAFLVMINTSSGAVSDVSILRSTGSAVLDNAAMSGFRRWRFQPGTVSQVQIPITFTLTGAAF